MITKEQYETIKSFLKSEFEENLFDASLENLKDKGNKLRFNNFAYSIRELSRHILVPFDRAEEIKNCEWYIPEYNREGIEIISRYQRIKYAVRGGITDVILAEWEVDVDELERRCKELVKIINILSKYTHIESKVFNVPSKEIEKLSKKVLDEFESFVKNYKATRTLITNYLDGVLEGHFIEDSSGNEFANLITLSHAYSLDEVYVDHFEISDINDQYIIADVSGSIGITLEWGSREDWRNDDGYSIGESFPFTTTIKYPIVADFESAKYEIKEYDADTSSWWEGFYDDEIDKLIEDDIMRSTE